MYNHGLVFHIGFVMPKCSLMLTLQLIVMKASLFLLYKRGNKLHRNNKINKILTLASAQNLTVMHISLQQYFLPADRLLNV